MNKKNNNIIYGNLHDLHIKKKLFFLDDINYDKELEYYCNNLDLLLSYYDNKIINKNIILREYLIINNFKNVTYKNDLLDITNYYNHHDDYDIEDNNYFYYDNNDYIKSYKRLNHVKEILNNLECKNNIDDKIILRVQNELKKCNINIISIKNIKSFINFIFN